MSSSANQKAGFVIIHELVHILMLNSTQEDKILTYSCSTYHRPAKTSTSFAPPQYMVPAQISPSRLTQRRWRGLCARVRVQRIYRGSPHHVASVLWYKFQHLPRCDFLQLIKRKKTVPTMVSNKWMPIPLNILVQNYIVKVWYFGAILKWKSVIFWCNIKVIKCDILVQY